MTQCAIDYSYARPDPQAIKASGYVAALRYLSTDPSKNLSPSERDSLFAVGLGIRLVWETTATEATQGFQAGANDGTAANNQADALGYPTSLPIYYAVDEQTSWSSVTAYFQGVQSVGRRPVKAYGDDAICDGAAGAGHGSDHWQCAAWSGGVVSSNAALYQRVTPTYPPISGGGYDEDAILKPVNWWTSTTPRPAPTPSQPTVYPGDNMQSTPILVSISGGHGWCASPVPATKVVNVVAEDMAPSVAGRYVIAPSFTGFATDQPNVPNGVLVFQPGGDGPAPNGNYGFVVWSVS